jgi:hypothetical protein
MSKNIINESGFPRIYNILRGLVPTVKSVGFISAENPYGKQASDVFNEEATKKLATTLRNLNLGFKMVLGQYGQEENTFFIPNITKHELMNLCNTFQQESVIFGEKSENGEYDGMTFQMIYTDNRFGQVVGERKVFINMQDADDFYTNVNGRKFQIPFFDSSHSDSTFFPNSGVIKKESVDESVVSLINNQIDLIFESDRTPHSRWINRGYLNKLLKEHRI